MKQTFHEPAAGPVRPATDLPQAREYLQVVRELTGYGTYTWRSDGDRFTDDSNLGAVLDLPSDALPRGRALHSYLQLVHPADRERVRRELTASLARNKVFSSRHRLLLHADGGTREIWVTNRARVHVDAETGHQQLTGVIADITDERLDQQGDLRHRKLDTIATMTAGIAHDFGNVLGPIISYAHLAKQEAAAGLSPQGSLEEITQAARRAKEIVARLLDYTRDDQPAQETFKLCELVTECCTLMQPQTGENVHLIHTCAPGLPPVQGDVTLLHQVIVNLITNAIHALQDRAGTVEAIVDEVVLGPYRHGMLDALPPGPYLRLRVKDTGTGINDAIIERLFDPFFTTKPKGRGTGIGLAAAQGHILNHGGTITAENNTDHGATFTAYLPIHDAEQTQGTDAPEPSKAHVLYVDDEPALLRLAKRALPLHGYTVDTHHDPQKALTAIRDDPRRYDILVTDYSMPGLNGLQLAAAIRAFKPTLPVILTSGYLTTQDHANADEVGVTEILPKPVSMNDIADEIDRHIQAS